MAHVRCTAWPWRPATKRNAPCTRDWIEPGRCRSLERTVSHSGDRCLSDTTTRHGIHALHPAEGTLNEAKNRVAPGLLRLLGCSPSLELLAPFSRPRSLHATRSTVQVRIRYSVSPRSRLYRSARLTHAQRLSLHDQPLIVAAVTTCAVCAGMRDGRKLRYLRKHLRYCGILGILLMHLVEQPVPLFRVCDVSNQSHMPALTPETLTCLRRLL